MLIVHIGIGSHRIMGATGQTLVIILSMHRSGSSLTASVLQRLGMSLGPFELMGASPSNPHGHFEAMPICELNRQVQGLFHGFIDDMPHDRGQPQDFPEDAGVPGTRPGRFPRSS